VELREEHILLNFSFGQQLVWTGVGSRF